MLLHTQHSRTHIQHTNLLQSLHADPPGFLQWTHIQALRVESVPCFKGLCIDVTPFGPPRACRATYDAVGLAPWNNNALVWAEERRWSPVSFNNVNITNDQCKAIQIMSYHVLSLALPSWLPLWLRHASSAALEYILQKGSFSSPFPAHHMHQRQDARDQDRLSWGRG